MKTIFTGWLMVMMLLGAVKMPGQEIGNLMPALADLPGWKMTSEPQIFIGDNLYELIDGGADIYLEYGFNRVASAHYADPSLNNIQVEVYEMNDAPSAYGIFSITQHTTEWSEQYGKLSAVNMDYISFWKSKYYVNMSWSSRQHPDQPSLARLADVIAQKIKEAGDYPAIVQTFEATDRQTKAVFMKGNLALSNFYYLDYKDIFSVKEAIAYSQGGYHKIVIKYTDEVEALEILASSKSGVLNNKRFTDMVMAFQGFSCRDNKGNFILVRQIENYIAILVALDSNTSLVPIMDEITLKIENSIK